MTGISVGLSEALVTKLGLGRGAETSNFAVMVLMAGILSAMFTTHAAPALYALLAKDLGLATGWPIEGVLMVQVGAWVCLLFPYIVPGLLIGARACGLRLRHVMIFMTSYSVIALLMILPLQFWWLKQLGYIP